MKPRTRIFENARKDIMSGVGRTRGRHGVLKRGNKALYYFGNTGKKKWGAARPGDGKAMME